jgi:hypothetical protein
MGGVDVHTKSSSNRAMPVGLVDIHRKGGGAGGRGGGPQIAEWLLTRQMSSSCSAFGAFGERFMEQ